MHREYRPEPRNTAGMTFPSDDIKIDGALEAELVAKQSIMGKVMPFLIAGSMVIMFGMMFLVGNRQISPYTLMMPMTMVLGLLGVSRTGESNSGTGEINLKRGQWILKLGEIRKQVHSRAEVIHAAYTDIFPNPAGIADLIDYSVQPVRKQGIRHVPKMWAASPTNTAPGAHDGRKHVASGILVNPYMVARVGVGLVPMYPQLKYGDVQVQENLEPVTSKMFTTFLRTQQVIPNTPSGIDLLGVRAVGMRGDADAALGLSRAVIASLAYNHSPQVLSMGVISDQTSTWDGMKWLPHTLNVKASAASGNTVHYAWSSFAEYVFRESENIQERKSLAGKAPHQVIFVDLPDSVVRFPPEISEGVPGVTFISVRAAKEEIASEKTRWMLKKAKNREVFLSLYGQLNFAKIDQISEVELEIIARKMGNYAPPGFLDSKIVTDPFAGVEVANFFEAIGVGNDLDAYDPRVAWRENAYTESFDAPVGYDYDYVHKRVLPTLRRLNIIETSRGGTGIHGFIQGDTGTGKSYMLKSIILSLCTKYGPDKYVQILADFKGGSTFIGFDKLAHTLAVISNLKSSEELVLRLQYVLQGELIRRQELFQRWKIKDILDYRAMQRDFPERNLDPLPDLFVWVDEFAQFMTAHKEYLDTLLGIGATGRSLGVHLILCSQSIEPELVGDFKKHTGFGISLRVTKTSSSNFVVGTPDATDLPSGTGIAINEKTNEQGEKVRAYFKSFNVEAQYVRVPRTSSTPTVKPLVVEKPEVTPYSFFQETILDTMTNLFEDISIDDFTPGDTEEIVYSRGVESVPVANTRLKRPMDAELLKTLAKAGEGYARVHQLWTTPMRVPLSFADIGVARRSPDKIVLQAGEIDYPMQHVRLPLEVDFSTTTHLQILGGPSSGKTTALMALAMSSMLSYAPSVCSWMYIDFKGSHLALFADMPNTLAYATRNDGEYLERITGMYYDLMSIREAAKSEHNLTNFNQYLAWKADPNFPERLAADPYGHVFLALDGYDYVTGDADRKDYWQSKLLDLLTSSTGLGLHIIITNKAEDHSAMRINGAIPEFLHLSSNDRITTGMPSHVDKIRYSQILPSLPANQPGRGINIPDLAYTLIAAPISSKIGPILELQDPSDPNSKLVPKEDEGMLVYDYYADLSERIGSFVRDIIEATPPELAVPRVKKAAQTIPWETIAPTLPMPALDHLDIVRFPLYLGTKLSTLEPFVVGEDGIHHAMAVGSNQSGRTNFLRVVIDNITRGLPPEKAQIVLFDGRLALLDDHARLVKSGYSNSKLYARNLETAETIVNMLTAQAAKMAPEDISQFTQRDIRERRFYTGKEMFILIDNFEDFSGKSSSLPRELWNELISRLRVFPNMGIHIIGTRSANEHEPNAEPMNPIARFLSSVNSPVIGLNGTPANGPISDIFRTIKFSRQTPGRGTVIDRRMQTSFGVQTFLSSYTDAD